MPEWCDTPEAKVHHGAMGHWRRPTGPRPHLEEIQSRVQGSTYSNNVAISAHLQRYVTPVGSDIQRPQHEQGCTNTSDIGGREELRRARQFFKTRAVGLTAEQGRYTPTVGEVL